MGGKSRKNRSLARPRQSDSARIHVAGIHDSQAWGALGRRWTRRARPPPVCSLPRRNAGGGRRTAGRCGRSRGASLDVFLLPPGAGGRCTTVRRMWGAIRYRTPMCGLPADAAWVCRSGRAGGLSERRARGHPPVQAAGWRVARCSLGGAARCPTPSDLCPVVCRPRRSGADALVTTDGSWHERR